MGRGRDLNNDIGNRASEKPGSELEDVALEKGTQRKNDRGSQGKDIVDAEYSSRHYRDVSSRSD